MIESYALPDCPAIRMAEQQGWPAQESLAVYVCKSCGEKICEGEVYVEFAGNHYHLDCAKDEALALLIEECGAVSGIAEVNVIC